MCKLIKIDRPVKRIELRIAACAIVFACGCSSIGGHSVSEAFPDNNARDLVNAALNHDSARVEEFVKSGVDVNYQGEEGVTPLAWVLALKDTKAAQALLEAGADSSKEMKGVNGRMTVVDLMAGGNSPDLLKLLLEHGGDPNSANSYGEPALVFAASNGEFENVELLIQFGADVNVHGVKMQGAPWYALTLGRYDMAVYLLEHGYTFDLDELASVAEARVVPVQSEQCHWRMKLFDILKEHNVVFPAFPRLHHGQPVSPFHLSDPCLPVWYPRQEAGVAQ